MDYRGYGERIDVTGDYTVEEIAQDAVALADELGVGTFSVVGHSVERSTREAFGAYLESYPALGADTAKVTWMETYPNARLEVSE